MRAETPTLVIGFVTYNPQESFFARLRLLANNGYAIYLFDNTPEIALTKQICTEFSNVYYSTAGNNVGLGIGLSIIGATSYYDGKTNLLFFDQDTCFSKDTLNYIEGVLNSLSPDISKDYALIAFNEKKLLQPILNNLQDTLLVISSGSLFILKNMKSIGWHNSSYFVDGVDYELCLRARVKGFRIGIHGNVPGFDHESEQPDKFFKIFGKKLPLRRYPIKRLVDSTKAYLRLIFYSIIHMDFRATWVISRSFLIFILGQSLSRIVLKGTD